LAPFSGSLTRRIETYQVPAVTCRSNQHRNRPFSTPQLDSRKYRGDALVVENYVLRPLQPACPHLQSISGVSSTASHCGLQYFLLESTVQLQLGCAHFFPVDVFMCFSSCEFSYFSSSLRFDQPYRIPIESQPTGARILSVVSWKPWLFDS
jgi:hypothetical protein